VTHPTAPGLPPPPARLWHALFSPQSQSNSSPHAHPNVQPLHSSPTRFSGELSGLLRKRLKIVALVLSIEKAFLLIGTFSFPLLSLRLTAIAVMFASFLILQSSLKLSIPRLRLIGFAMLGAFFTQATAMPNALILERARAGDFPTANMDYYFVLGAAAVFVILYGLLIPNTARRASMIIIPLSIIPNLNFYLLGLYEPAVHKALSAVSHGPPVPLMLLAAAVGIYGAHTLHTIRYSFFKAKQLGRYRLLEKLGQGGMGQVYRAQHDLLKRPCAIKLIAPGLDADPAALARFEREVQATARLSHPNTVEIYDYGRTDQGVFYYVMELLKGDTLQDMVTRHGPMAPDRAVKLLTQVSSAVQEAHSLGLIHRDIKPANIFVVHHPGQEETAKLLDFGLVKTTAPGPDDLAGLTIASTVIGSPHFSSPEQATGNPVDTRTDIYSLGAVLYFLLTGSPPFTGASAIDITAGVTRDNAIPPSHINPQVPHHLDHIILTCLQKNPADRYPDAQSLIQALTPSPSGGGLG
jgi:eukaryotic-like serine/threonine-protein kinase